MPKETPQVVLSRDQYGKAEVRLLHVDRAGPRHEITDLNVTVTLAGDMAATYLTGDNSGVLTTDAQKNTVYAFARSGVRPVEEFALRLGRHFAQVGSVHRAQVRIEEYGWRRIDAGGGPHPHSFERLAGTRIVSAFVHSDGRAEVVAGVGDLVLLKSTGSEFHGFLVDRYTTLAPTDDRILATAVAARWRISANEADWAECFRGARTALAEAFAITHSLSLQQTLYAMGEAVLLARSEVAEVRMAMPNRHHFAVDLTPFGMANENEVFYASDRPYGLIEGTITRDDVPEPGMAW